MLEIKDLCFSPGGKEIIKHLDLSVPDGKLIIITGPNGGGKTTLAKLIAGIERPDSGQIIFNGRDISALDPTERALAGISYGFQQPVRFKGFTVRELLTIAKGGELSDEELSRTLSLVGLDADTYADRALDSHLSGGEIKRIEIASVFLRDSELAIFDEPEAGIDLWSFNALI
ncbi:MAG: ATP-binding cassette domain-containing protein, partial [Firmicutes bacterium]|nr:ATP-binding cassette domain-containing protein [Bacillota bacterium]